MSYPLSHTVVNKKKEKEEEQKRTIKLIFRGQSRTVNNINIKTPYHAVYFFLQEFEKLTMIYQ
jgi:hypothetical protein